MEFEATCGIYSQDLADEGVKTVFDNLQKRARLNAVYIMAFSHGPEKRPYYQDVYPHNPKRKTFVIEDCVVYFKAHPEFYENTKIKPKPTQTSFLKGTDWVDVLIAEARKRGMKAQAEFGHHFVSNPMDYPDCLQKDVYGNPVNPVQVCINNEDVRNYFLGLIEDITTNHDLDMLQPSSIIFRDPKPEVLLKYPFLRAALGGCFCEACEEKARKWGFDWEAIKEAVKKVNEVLRRATPEAAKELKMLEKSLLSPEDLLLEMPDFYSFLQFRFVSVASLLKDEYRVVKKANPSTEMRQNYSDPMRSFVDFKRLKGFVDSVRLMDYSEQFVRINPMSLEAKRTKLIRLRRAIGDKVKMISGIGVRPYATPETVKMGIRIAVETGADGISLGFYDGAALERLDAVGEVLEELGLV